MRTLLMATVAMAGLAASADASVTTFTSSAAFNAVTSNRTSYSFPANAPVGQTSETSPYTSGPLSFADTSIELSNDGGYGAGVIYLGAFNNPSTGAKFVITTSGSPTALSFNIGTYNPVESVGVAVNGANVATLAGTTGAPSTSFFGITDTSPIMSVVFTNLTTPGDEIDLVSFATGTLVTEPASVALLGVGVLGLGLTRRRVRRAYSRSR